MKIWHISSETYQRVEELKLRMLNLPKPQKPQKNFLDNLSSQVFNQLLLLLESWKVFYWLSQAASSEYSESKQKELMKKSSNLNCGENLLWKLRILLRMRKVFGYMFLAKLLEQHESLLVVIRSNICFIKWSLWALEKICELVFSSTKSRSWSSRNPLKSA